VKRPIDDSDEGKKGSEGHEELFGGQRISSTEHFLAFSGVLNGKGGKPARGHRDSV